jgi:hypothetical protein
VFASFLEMNHRKMLKAALKENELQKKEKLKRPQEEIERGGGFTKCVVRSKAYASLFSIHAAFRIFSR